MSSPFFFSVFSMGRILLLRYLQISCMKGMNSSPSEVLEKLQRELPHYRFSNETIASGESLSQTQRFMRELRNNSPILPGSTDVTSAWFSTFVVFMNVPCPLVLTIVYRIRRKVTNSSAISRRSSPPRSCTTSASSRRR